MNSRSFANTEARESGDEKAIRLGLNPEIPRYWDSARGDGVSVGGRFPTTVVSGNTPRVSTITPGIDSFRDRV